MGSEKIALVASDSPPAQAAYKELSDHYDIASPETANIVVALGGDGFMLQTLHRFMPRNVPIYGMNQGTVGFLMNEFKVDGLVDRIARAQTATLKPLTMSAIDLNGTKIEGLAINEVSLLRETRYAAQIRIWVDDRMRLETLVTDGVMVATPAGSTAYNLSAHGPILPLGAPLLAMTPICAYRPRRWRGALLSDSARVRFEIIEPERRSVYATADYTEAHKVVQVDIAQHPTQELKLLFDPEHNLEERIISEQFAP